VRPQMSAGAAAAAVAQGARAFQAFRTCEVAYAYERLNAVPVDWPPWAPTSELLVAPKEQKIVNPCRGLYCDSHGHDTTCPVVIRCSECDFGWLRPLCRDCFGHVSGHAASCTLLTFDCACPMPPLDSQEDVFNED
jgi:hypothetical protein